MTTTLLCTLDVVVFFLFVFFFYFGHLDVSTDLLCIPLPRVYSVSNVSFVLLPVVLCQFCTAASGAMSVLYCCQWCYVSFVLLPVVLCQFCTAASGAMSVLYCCQWCYAAEQASCLEFLYRKRKQNFVHLEILGVSRCVCPEIHVMLFL